MYVECSTDDAHVLPVHMYQKISDRNGANERKYQIFHGKNTLRFGSTVNQINQQQHQSQTTSEVDKKQP